MKPEFTSPILNPSYDLVDNIIAAIPMMEGTGEVLKILGTNPSAVATLEWVSGTVGGWDWVAAGAAESDELSLRQGADTNDPTFILSGLTENPIPLNSKTGSIMIRKFQVTAPPSNITDYEVGDSTGGTTKVLVRADSSGNNDVIQIGTGGTSTSGYFSFASPEQHTTILTWDTSTGDQAYYVGSATNQISVDNAVANPDESLINIFCRSALAGADRTNAGAELQTIVIFDVELTTGEVSSLMSDPYQVYAEESTGIDTLINSTINSSINSTIN